MESVESNGGGGLVVTQLSHIKELVKQLEVHLGGSPDLCKHLTSEISSVTERSIGMIIRSGAGGYGYHHRKRAAGDGDLDSAPPSATNSPLSDVSNLPFKTTKKRKTMEKKKHQIRVNSASGMENPSVDDGHSWRKYGQKEILGAKHPRGYYRCTHRNTQGCQATKQVQRTDEDPTLFDVIYHGEHTCVQKAVAAGAGAGKPLPERNTDAHSRLQDLSAGLTVKTEKLQAAEPQQPGSRSAMPFCFTSPVSGLAPPEPEHNPFSTPSSLSPSMVSPATSDSNHLYVPEPFQAIASDAEVVSALMAAVASAPAPAMAGATTDLYFADGFEFNTDFTIESIDISSYFV